MSILAIVSIAVFGQGGETVRQLVTLEQQTLARWVAENEVAKLHLGRLAMDEPLGVGTRRDRVSHGDRTWLVVEEVAATDHPLVQRVEFSVYALVEGREVGPVDRLVHYVGEY